MFVKLIHHLLHVGGKAAVIVPQGVLFGSSKVHVALRKTLLEESQLEAVITLPSGVFKPYSGVATAILVFTKGGKTDNVWFYEVTSDGFSLDDKRTFVDGKGDLPEVVKQFKTKAATKQSFLVPFEQIKQNDYNLNLSQYKKHVSEKIEYEKPEVLIEQILKKEEEITQELKGLRDGLKKGLKDGLKKGLVDGLRG